MLHAHAAGGAEAVLRDLQSRVCIQYRDGGVYWKADFNTGIKHMRYLPFKPELHVLLHAKPLKSYFPTP